MIRIIAMAAAAWALSAADVRAEDIKGSADHPLVSRYEGARIVGYMTKAFDEYRGIVGPHRVEGGRGRYADLVDLEGTITRILYAAPKGRSTLEIYRNHEQALTGAGFEPIFACKGQECGGNFYGYAQRLWRNGNWIRDVFATAPAGQRYLAARLKRAEGDVYVFLFVSEHKFLNSLAGPYVQLDVVQLAAMQANLVKVDPAALGKDIESEGHAAVYGILFDTGKAAIKPESRDALAAVAKLLADRPALRLHVVGHTDSTGGFDYNLDLSKRRAAAVVEALVKQHGVAAGRLKANGVGPLAPVATNRTEAGRAENRRVELVERPEGS